MPSVRPFLRAVTAAALGFALTAAAAPATTAAVGHLTDPDAVTVGTATVIPGTSYAFTALVGGQPVRWNPCAAIHWRSNASRGPVGGLDVLKAAVSAIDVSTGVHWVYDGPSSATPRVSSLSLTTTAQQPVLVGWTDSTSSDLLRGQTAMTVGMTRTVWFSSSSSTGVVAATRGAVVALNRASRLPLRGGVSWQTAITHELGHVMGLAHAKVANEVMAPVLSTGISALQAGDRVGLSKVGRPAGCVAFPSA